jgi:deoxyadenosine/deoxycytidine kinase
MKDTKYLSLEGVISAGKTTTLEELTKELKRLGKTYGIVNEPLDIWMKNGLLKTFYSDTSRYGYLFQTKAFHDRVMACEEAHKKYHGKVDYVILERSVYTDSIFMEQLYTSGQISQLEWDCYNDWWKMWQRFIPFTIDCVSSSIN